MGALSKTPRLLAREKDDDLGLSRVRLVQYQNDSAENKQSILSRAWKLQTLPEEVSQYHALSEAMV